MCICCYILVSGYLGGFLSGFYVFVVGGIVGVLKLGLRLF